MGFNMTLLCNIRKLQNQGASRRAIAKELKISRNTFRKYCDGAADVNGPVRRKRAATVATQSVKDIITGFLDSDAASGINKHRHTAKRCYDRLKAEHAYTGSYSSVTAMVREIKATKSQCFVPQVYFPGEKLQVDFGEMWADLRGAKTKIYVFCARLCYSCRPVVLAYRSQDRVTFLHALRETFKILGGVPSQVIFDNAKVAVLKGYGTKAVAQERYQVFAAHYNFEPVFCNPAQGHEKGLVEGLVRWTRSNMFVPMPKVESMEELNSVLSEACLKYEQQTIRGREGTVGQRFEEERRHLRPLPLCEFEPGICLNGRVSDFSTVTVETNTYSVPVEYSGLEVAIRVNPETVEVYFKGKRVACHERLQGRGQHAYRLEHYMPLLQKRPRAMLDAAPVRQRIPAEILDQLKAQHATSEQIIQTLNHYVSTSTAQATVVIKEPENHGATDLGQYDALRQGSKEESL